MTDMNDDDILAKAEEIKAARSKVRNTVRSAAYALEYAKRPEVIARNNTPGAKARRREYQRKYAAKPESKEKHRKWEAENKDRTTIRAYARFVAKREGHGDVERVLRRIEPEYAKPVDTEADLVSLIKTTAAVPPSDDYLDGIQQHMGYLPQKG